MTSEDSKSAKREQYAVYVMKMVKEMGLDLEVAPNTFFVDSKDMVDSKTEAELNALSAWLAVLEPLSTTKLQVRSDRTKSDPP